MKDTTYKWEDIDWNQTQADVFQEQKRIFRKSTDNRHTETHAIQKRLTQSWSARCLAVRRAAEDSRGKSTPGIDGLKNLSDAQKLQLAKQLSIRQRPKPVRRIYIPKPGSRELRPLGIPTIADRALQHLITFALEPEWEAHFAPHQYGFRRGRCCHDALVHIRKHIRRCPKWVLDADIEKFFDRLDHPALLKKLNTWPQMRTAISRILKSGAMEGTTVEPTKQGTPQGGPLSPLLANIALSGLEKDLEQAIGAGTRVRGYKVKTPPRIVLYADDFVVLHESRMVVEAAKVFIEDWLAPMGLNLSSSKTRITHTLEKVDGHQAGFDFLGCRVQQFRVSRHAASSFFKGVWTDIRPSHEGMQRLLQKCEEIIQKMGPHKKRNAAYQQRQEKGSAGPIEVMTIHLNKALRGWCTYHKQHNAKKAFSRIDHELYKKLWKWAKRTFPRRGHRRLVKELWLAKGPPWRFRAPSDSTNEPYELYQAASTPIERHWPVQSGRSYYDGDWLYWATRQGRYPGIPPNVARLTKRQGGKCATCKQELKRSDGILVVGKQRSGNATKEILLHQRCDGNPSEDSAQGHTDDLGVSLVARCIERCTPGFEGNHVRKDVGTLPIHAYSSSRERRE